MAWDSTSACCHSMNLYRLAARSLQWQHFQSLHWMGISFFNILVFYACSVYCFCNCHGSLKTRFLPHFMYFWQHLRNCHIIKAFAHSKLLSEHMITFCLQLFILQLIASCKPVYICQIHYFIVNRSFFHRQ